MPAGDGRSTSPYKSLASLQGSDLDGTGDTIFRLLGLGYGRGIPLEANQKLFGQPFGLLVRHTSAQLRGRHQQARTASSWRSRTDPGGRNAGLEPSPAALEVRAVTMNTLRPSGHAIAGTP